MFEGRGGQFYGAVTVSERGQIVIPARARRDLDIEVGEKLLVVGGPGGALLLVRASVVGRMVSRWADLVRQLREDGLDKVEEVDEEET